MREQTEREALEAAETWLRPPDEPYPEYEDEDEECEECGSRDLHYVHDGSDLVAIECGECGHEQEV